jgi:hypothetical protein
MAQKAGRDPDLIEVSSFGLADDVDRVKRLTEMGVVRVVPIFLPEKVNKVLPIIGRWTNIMLQTR